MFKTNFSGRNKIWGEQRNLGGHGPRMPPVATGLWYGPRAFGVLAVFSNKSYLLHYA